MKLNARQKAFCEYYVASGNATDSAIKAGYKEKYAGVNADKLLKNTNIQKYIEELQEKAKGNRIMTAIERREFLTSMIKNGAVKDTDRLKALDILNKMDGEYTQKVEVNGNINSNPFSNLTTEELKQTFLKANPKGVNLKQKFLVSILYDCFSLETISEFLNSS